MGITDVLADIIQGGLRRKGPKGTPIAQASSFGWLVSGKIDTTRTTTEVVANSVQTELLAAVERFWELEEAPVTKLPSREQMHCEEHFVSTHQRDVTGRFIVRFPFKSKEVLLDSEETRNIALHRLRQVSQRLSTRPLQREEYNLFLQDYEQLGHMEKISLEEVRMRALLFLPHHSVLKESSTTTRLRVVFDASVKIKSGITFNDHLMVGATLQDDVFSIMIRFRTHLLALTADIAKMYRQKRIHDDDTCYQTIVWHRSMGDPVEYYRMLTLTYGTASAPYLATRCLQQLAREDGENYPEASAIIMKDFYIDDLMSGADTFEEARRLKDQLVSLLHRGGFHLRKWSSNSEDLIKSIPLGERDSQSSLILGDAEVIKTLGLRWHPKPDHFSFGVEQPESTAISTKRTLLSVLAKIYDPMGWLTPVTVKPKIFIQQLWRAQCTWDEPIPVNMQDGWIQYLEELKNIETLKIPRVLAKDVLAKQELHGFCDASEQSYAAVIYLRSESSKGNREVKLIVAKSRVAPLKTISLPRLELCGALLLAKLFVSVQSAFRRPIPTIYAWTDSTIALAWIRANGTRWKTFVANRVTMIQDRVPAKQWHHVRGQENPADCASRGINPSELKDHSIWWNGPAWLLNPVTADPPPVESMPNELIQVEERVVLATMVQEPHLLLTRYSSLATLTRVTAYQFRFRHNCSTSKDDRLHGPLSRDELARASNFWIRNTREQVFSIEMRCLETDKPLPRESRLVSLNPFLVPAGLIRVGGRLRNAPIHSDQKHPMILPKNHDLTTLVVRQEHNRLLHAGPQLLLASSQLRFWILG